MIKAVIFDLGDTLVLNSATKEKINKTKLTWELFKQNGIKCSYGDFVEAEQKAKDIYDFEFYGKQERFLPGLFYRFIGDSLRVKLSDEIYAKIDDAINDAFMENMQLPENVFETLEKLKKMGLRLGVISNGHSRTVLRKLDKSGLRNYFDKVFLSFELGENKSSLTAFNKIIKELGLHANECVMVGDRKDEDMYAKKVGMHTVLVKYVPQKRVAKEAMEPDYSINKFEEIIGVIHQLNKENKVKWE